MIDNISRLLLDVPPVSSHPMSARYFIDVEHRVVYSHARGELTHAVLHDHQKRLLADAQFNPDFRQLADFGDITSVPLTAAQIRELAHRKLFQPGSARAFVVNCGLQHGIGRMFIACSEHAAGEDVNISLFNDQNAACLWLNLPPEQVKAAFARLRATAE